MTCILFLAWKGLDTVLVNAGVSAVRPLLEIAGVQNRQGSSSYTQASADNIKETVRIADVAQKTNFIGPLISAVTFVRYAILPSFVISLRI